MAIFDRFVLKEPGGQKKKLPPVTHNQRVYAQLDDSALEAKEKYPEDSKIVDNFVSSLKNTYRIRRKKSMDGFLEPMRAEAQFFLSADRMTAYACVLPPENGGEDLIHVDNFWEDMYCEGIVSGTLQDTIAQDFAEGYLHIFPVARGRAPQPGEDGKVRELFRRRRHMRLEVENGSQVNFNEEVPLQPIRKGTVICVIRSPKEGINGMDVTGLEIPSPKPVSVQVIPGRNVHLGREGHALMASTDGILYSRAIKFAENR